MRQTSLFKKQLQRFRGESSGSVAVIFALAAIPVFMVAGVAIDMVRSTDARVNLQTALDAGALSAAAHGGLSDSERKDIAKATFAANFKPISGVTITPDVSIDDGAVSMSADFPFPTAFMRIAGINTVDLGSSVTVNLPDSKKAEIALVLDYSG